MRGPTLAHHTLQDPGGPRHTRFDLFRGNLGAMSEDGNKTSDGGARTKRARRSRSARTIPPAAPKIAPASRDFVRRAVSAGVGAASRSKDDIMRVAAGEMRNWLEHLNLNEELGKALAKLVIEVKTEIRFRPTEDGKLVPETTNDIKVKSPPK